MIYVYFLRCSCIIIMNRRCFFFNSSCRAVGESPVDILCNMLADSLIYIILIGREFEETNRGIA